MAAFRHLESFSIITSIVHPDSYRGHPRREPVFKCWNRHRRISSARLNHDSDIRSLSETSSGSFSIETEFSTVAMIFNMTAASTASPDSFPLGESGDRADSYDSLMLCLKIEQQALVIFQVSTRPEEKDTGAKRGKIKGGLSCSR